MHIIHHFGHVVGGSLLIAGTTIGVGILAMPIATGPGGFIPSLFIFLLCWVFMLFTGLLLLEVCFWMPKEANLITMTDKILGPVGRIVCWIVYLFLFLTVMIAHVAGGGNLVSEMTNQAISPMVAMIIYVIVFAPVVYLGTQSVDRLNLILMAGLAITYFALVGIAAKNVSFELLSQHDWTKAWIAIPVLFTAFTYQIIIPTLVTYMKRDFKKVRLSIIVGSAIPLIIYLVWEFTILGIVPSEGEFGLVRAGELGQTAVVPLKHLLDNTLLFTIGKYFAFFTMTVSYVALSLAFVDFLADGLHMKKKGYRKFILLLMVFVPPTIISLIRPDIFHSALRYAGGISISILFGLLPPLMVWIGRYKKKYPKMPHALKGGKALLGLLIVMILVELFYDLIIHQ